MVDIDRVVQYVHADGMEVTGTDLLRKGFVSGCERVVVPSVSGVRRAPRMIRDSLASRVRNVRRTDPNSSCEVSVVEAYPASLHFAAVVAWVSVMAPRALRLLEITGAELADGVAVGSATRGHIRPGIVELLDAQHGQRVFDAADLFSQGVTTTSLGVPRSVERFKHEDEHKKIRQRAEDGGHVGRVGFRQVGYLRHHLCKFRGHGQPHRPKKVSFVAEARHALGRKRVVPGKEHEHPRIERHRERKNRSVDETALAHGFDIEPLTMSDQILNSDQPQGRAEDDDANAHKEERPMFIRFAKAHEQTVGSGVHDAEVQERRDFRPLLELVAE